MKLALAAGVVLMLGVLHAQTPAGSVQTSAPVAPAQIASLPPAVNRPVDFVREIKPILQASCVKCHGRGRSKGGFSLETRDALLEGGDSGPAIVPGASQDSHLIMLVAGLDPDLVMPKKGSRLKPEQIALLRGWIDQGVPWDPSVSFAKLPPRNIDPREAVLEAGGAAGGAGAVSGAGGARGVGGARSTGAAGGARSAEGNPIDRLLAPYFAEHGIAPGPIVDDRRFARRVYLDAIGLLPTPREQHAFIAERRADKRERLVEALLNDRRRHAEHWLSFWNDALRNDYRGTGYIDGGRRQISNWLYNALFENVPYDRFVAQLINPVPGAEGFTKGIIWRGVVNASQSPPMQAAQNVSQVFMGVNLKCASCHDSFINDWQLADAYGLAGIYAEAPLEMVECDRPTGHTAPMKFLYAKLGTIDAKAARATRLQQLATVITGRTNGRLSRTIVNRLWARFMGRGLVEPVDDMEQPAWDVDLLDWLAEDLVAHGYDLKRTMGLILTSRAYQMTAIDLPESGRDGGASVFRGPMVRRMSAEQFADALSRITGVWHGMPAGDIDFTAALGDSVPAVRARWIWRGTEADAQRGTNADAAAAGAVTFRKTFLLAAGPVSARALVAYDGPFVLNVNGKKVSEVKGTAGPSSIDIRSALRMGQNQITLVAKPPPAAAVPDEAVRSASRGVLVELLVHPSHPDTHPGTDARLTLMAGSDRTWQWQADDGTWRPAVDNGDAEAAVDSVVKALHRAVAAASLDGRTRAALVTADPLALALGRPNREQVVTTRTTAATTMQALELSNGATLTTMLQQGAKRLLADKPTRAMLIARIYRRALGRGPTVAEAKLCREALGPTPRPEGVQDLLWAVAMLPEFQLIE